MFDAHALSMAGGCLLLLAALFWAVSIPLHNVSIVDSLWSLMIVGAGYVYLWQLSVAAGPRPAVVMLIATVWALRLSIYISTRNWGHGEDRRYQEIRRRNEPGFVFKSLYLVFVLQAVLALIVSLPLMPAINSERPWHMLDWLGAVLAVFGLSWEAIGDAQLARFKQVEANRGKVMDRGLWRYSRHPNYFGEACVWWGLFLCALAAGGWWAVLSPLLMSVLLLKVSGVGLLEKDIGERRPAYADYIRRTNAFFPWRPRA